jgi:hypothetical protein
MSGSEVARLRRQIDLEYEAFERLLKESAIVSKHAFITARTEIFASYHEQLVKHVGPEQAAELMIAYIDEKTEVVGRGNTDAATKAPARNPDPLSSHP